MSWTISKEFEFDYGHRVHNQILDSKYSENALCKCRHLHGHRGKIVVYLFSEELNAQGMVTDFNHLNWFKKLLDGHFDHKMILDIKDPFSEYNLGQGIKKAGYKKMANNIGRNLWLEYNDIKNLFTDNVPAWATEIRQSAVYVPFNPTSENLAQFFYDLISNEMGKMKIAVSKVEFYETPKSKAIYVSSK